MMMGPTRGIEVLSYVIPRWQHQRHTFIGSSNQVRMQACMLAAALVAMPMPAFAADDSDLRSCALLLPDCIKG